MGPAWGQFLIWPDPAAILEDRWTGPGGAEAPFAACIGQNSQPFKGKEGAHNA
ncbi:MAG: hypothetical protein HOB79_00610 [Rhodospirillaceae bacterium]|nr:hypothetical protein [Rhodospirillaceae bacterium]MBT8002236.1 hypothetical protein [Rhodospirillales bacterium]